METADALTPLEITHIDYVVRRLWWRDPARGGEGREMAVGVLDVDWPPLEPRLVHALRFCVALQCLFLGGGGARS